MQRVARRHRRVAGASTRHAFDPAPTRTGTNLTARRYRLAAVQPVGIAEHAPEPGWTGRQIEPVAGVQDPRHVVAHFRPVPSQTAGITGTRHDPCRALERLVGPGPGLPVPVDGEQLGLEGQRLERLERVADPRAAGRPFAIATAVDVSDDRAIEVDTVERAGTVDRDELGRVARPAPGALRTLEPGVRRPVAE